MSGLMCWVWRTAAGAAAWARAPDPMKNSWQKDVHPSETRHYQFGRIPI